MMAVLAMEVRHLEPRELRILLGFIRIVMDKVRPSCVALSELSF